ncbi:hypothetical protein RJ639_002792 [Escallonia herrerae]|uniref:C2H2-type domain-containing protein n=1 Tax=Escallonia herrerae TaxID=1293975 RepID=A0AA88W1K1_9ASTE|nr:hypothetical protein RJ639_002792 [Escallonia herrerae]
MRSHMLNLCVPPKAEQPASQLGEPSTESASSSSEEEEGNEDKGLLCYELRENPKKSIRLADQEFSTVDGGSVILQDRESETESSKNPTRRRSKRIRKSGVSNHHQCNKLSKTTESLSWVEPEPVSSISDTTPEEDVAYCLMMLSRDNWMRETNNELGETDKYHVDEGVNFESPDDSDEEIKVCKNRVRAKYRCETCNRVFRSYQALGGHRASHKKIKLNHSSSAVEAETNEGKVEEKIHECPVCYRVFSSGQALGGHKRSHVTGPSAISTTITTSPAQVQTKPSNRHGENLIDLNLPAPMDDDGYSHFELSAVSDAEFVNPFGH